jgi:hypothetical protein
VSAGRTRPLPYTPPSSSSAIHTPRPARVPPDTRYQRLETGD